MIRAIAALLLAAPLMAAQAPRATVVRNLQPVDEAVQRPDFFSLRAGLIAAIGRRDAAVIRALVHPRIRNSFGPDDGVKTFEDTWRLEEPESRFWEELASVLALGGRFMGDATFVAPYTSAAWPDDLDGFEHVAIVASDVHVRAAPRPDAASLGRVSFGVLARWPSSDREAVQGWTAVRWAGRPGFVASRFARSPIDYRAFFTFESGRWWLTAFVAGD